MTGYLPYGLGKLLMFANSLACSPSINGRGTPTVARWYFIKGARSGSTRQHLLISAIASTQRNGVFRTLLFGVSMLVRKCTRTSTPGTISNHGFHGLRDVPWLPWRGSPKKFQANGTATANIRCLSGAQLCAS